MDRIKDTYCPLCGERDIFVTVRDGKKIAHCGADLKMAHTAWAMGPDVEALHPIYNDGPKEPIVVEATKKPVPNALGEED